MPLRVFVDVIDVRPCGTLRGTCAESPLGLGEVAQHLLLRLIALLGKRLEEIDHFCRSFTVLRGFDDFIAGRGKFDLCNVPSRAPRGVLADSSRHALNLGCSFPGGSLLRRAALQAAEIEQRAAEVEGAV